MKSISIFCASSTQVPNKYFIATRQLATEILKLNMRVYYGGGAVGLMGELANEILKQQGSIVGIIPEFMMQLEWGNKEVDELLVVADMYERKKLLLEKADVICALPGGVGTYDELLEAIVQRQLGQINAGIIICNVDGFYNSFLQILDQMIDERFLRAEYRDIWQVINAPSELEMAINRLEGHRIDACRAQM